MTACPAKRASDMDTAESDIDLMVIGDELDCSPERDNLVRIKQLKEEDASAQSMPPWFETQSALARARLLATRAALRRLAEPLVERIAGAAYGADRVGGAAAIERAAQPTDMHVDGALVDVDVAPP